MEMNTVERVLNTPFGPIPVSWNGVASIDAKNLPVGLIAALGKDAEEMMKALTHPDQLMPLIYFGDINGVIHLANTGNLQHLSCKHLYTAIYEKNKEMTKLLLMYGCPTDQSAIDGIKINKWDDLIDI